MTELFTTLLKLSITASYIAIAAVLFRLIFKKAPKTLRLVLWGLVALRLVIPVSFSSIFSVLPANETYTPTVINSTLREFTEPETYAGNTEHTTEQNPTNEDVKTQIEISEPSAPAKNISVMDILSYVWVFGAVCMLGYAAVSYSVLHKKVSRSTMLEKDVYESAKVQSPFILGIFRPRIYLPVGITETDKANVLMHERMHIRHGDHFIKPFAYLLLSVYWFNPLLWLAYILLCRDIEMICDERVIKKLGADVKKSYSESLLNLAVKRAGIAMCPLSFGEVSTEKRVKNVLAYKKSALIISICAAVVCIAVGVCLLTVPKAGNTSASDTSQSDVVRPDKSGKSIKELQRGVYAPVTEFVSNPRRDYSQLIYCIDDNYNLIIGCPNGSLTIGKLKNADELRDDEFFNPEYIANVNDLTYTDLYVSRFRNQLSGRDKVELRVYVDKDYSHNYTVMQYSDGTILFLVFEDTNTTPLYAALLSKTDKEMPTNTIDRLWQLSYDDAIGYLKENGAVPPFSDNFSEFNDSYTDDLYEEYIHAAIDLSAFMLYTEQSAMLGNMVTSSFLCRSDQAICDYYGIDYVLAGNYKKIDEGYLYRDKPDRLLEIGLLDYCDEMNYELIIRDGAKIVSRFHLGNTHACYDTYYLYGDNMLIEYNPYVSGGIGEFRYNVFQLNNNGNLVLPKTDAFSPRGSVTFRYDEYCADENREANFPNVTEFLAMLDKLLENSVLLCSTDYGVLNNKVFDLESDAPDYEVITTADLRHDGTKLEIGIRHTNDTDYQRELIISDGGKEVVAVYPISDTHSGWETFYLLRYKGKDYLLQYHPTIYQGYGNFEWTVFYLDKDGNVTTKGLPADMLNQRTDEFDYMAFEKSRDKKKDFPDIYAFLDRLDGLLKDCTLLYSNDDFIINGRQETWRD